MEIKSDVDADRLWVENLRKYPGHDAEACDQTAVQEMRRILADKNSISYFSSVGHFPTGD